MKLITSPDRAELAKKLDRKLFQSLEGYGITLHSKWKTIVDNIENSIRIANSADVNSPESKPDLDMAVSLAYRLLIDIDDVAKALRRDRKDPSGIECRTFAANTAMAITVLYELFDAYGLARNFVIQIETHFGINVDESVIEIENKIITSLQPRNTLPIGASREARAQLSLVTGIPQAAVPQIANGISGESEKTNPYGINIEEIHGTTNQDAGNNGSTAEFQADPLEETQDPPETARGLGGYSYIGTDNGLVQTPEPKPAQTPEPKPAQTPEPKPAQTPEPKPAQTPEPKPAQTPEPKPAQTPEPKPIESSAPAMPAQSPAPAKPATLSDPPTIEVQGPDPRQPISQRPQAPAIPIEDDRGYENPTPEPKPKSDPPKSETSRPSSAADDDTAPFSRDQLEELPYMGGGTRAPSKLPQVTVHKVEPAPPTAATPAKTLGEPDPQMGQPYRNPAAKTEEPAKPQAEPKPPAAPEPKNNTAPSITAKTPPNQTPKPESIRPPQQSNPEQTIQDTKTGFRKWLERNKRAAVLIGGLAGIGAVYGAHRGISQESHPQTAEFTTVATTATPATARATTATPAAKPASTAIPLTPTSEAIQEKIAQKKTFKIDSHHKDFQEYLKSLNGAEGIIRAMKYSANNIEVELTGKESPMEAQVKVYRAFLQKGADDFSKEPGIHGAFKTWIISLDHFEKATGGMNDEQKSEYLERGEYKQIKPQLQTASNRVENTLPEGISGFTVEMDPNINPSFSAFTSKFPSQAPTLYKTVMETYGEIANNPLKAGRYHEAVTEFMNRVTAKAQEKIKNNPGVPDGSLFVLNQIDKYFIQKGRGHLITEPLRVLIPVSNATKKADSEGTKNVDTTAPPAPSFTPAPMPSHTFLSPLRPNKRNTGVKSTPANTHTNSFATLEEEKEFDNGWTTPYEAAPEKVSQKTAIKEPLQLRSLSGINQPRTNNDARLTVREMAAQLSTNNPGMRMAPVMPLAQRSNIAQSQPLMPKTASPSTPNANPPQANPAVPKQTIGQKIASYAGKAASYVKGLFTGKELTPAIREQRELQAQIPKKSFLNNLFG